MSGRIYANRDDEEGGIYVDPNSESSEMREFDGYKKREREALRAEDSGETLSLLSLSSMLDQEEPKINKEKRSEDPNTLTAWKHESLEDKITVSIDNSRPHVHLDELYMNVKKQDESRKIKSEKATEKQERSSSLFRHPYRITQMAFYVFKVSFYFQSSFSSSSTTAAKFTRPARWTPANIASWSTPT